MKFSEADVVEAHQELIQSGCLLRSANDHGTHGTFVEVKGRGAKLVVSQPFADKDKPKDWHQVRYYVDSPTVIVQEQNGFRWAGLQGGVPLDPIARHEQEIYYRVPPRYSTPLKAHWQELMRCERAKREVGWLPFAEARYDLCKCWYNTLGFLAFWLTLHIPEGMVRRLCRIKDGTI